MEQGAREGKGAKLKGNVSGQETLTANEAEGKATPTNRLGWQALLYGRSQCDSSSSELLSELRLDFEPHPRLLL